MTFPVEITDEFTNSVGEWDQYVAIPEDQRKDLRSQRHVNIRSFSAERKASPVTMLFLDQLTMYSMDGKTLSVFTKDAVSPASIIIEENERWTNGVVKRQADRNYWNGITIECDTAVSNLTTSESIIAI